MKRRIIIGLIVLVFISTIFLPANIAAASTWQNGGNPVCIDPIEQKNAVICSDGQGGAIIAWEDFRIDGSGDVYAQRMSSTGAPQWAADGVVICNAVSWQQTLAICSDGVGGAILVWKDLRNGNADIYTQRVNSEGNSLWTSNGVPIVNLTGVQERPELCTDGASGAIIVWVDNRVTGSDIYAQRIKANGQLNWTINGIPICTKAGTQSYPKIINNGTDGAIMCWSDTNIYAQKVTAAGASQWGANGTVICNASNTQIAPEICSDGAGGAIIVWPDDRVSWDIYAQRITSVGAMQWGANGSAICNADLSQLEPQICSVNSGGAIMAWRDYRSGGSNDIYAQYVTQNGEMPWTSNGIAICNTPDDEQTGVRICSDGADGVIMAWNDYRSDPNGDIYAQRVRSSGELLWQINGTVVCDSLGYNTEHKLTNAGVGAAIITWHDDRNGQNDIYALKIPMPSGGGGDPGLILLLLLIPIVGVAVGVLILYLRREQLE
ncbi:MAG: hypothetical protein LUQ65_11860 [Candidatus Helarchaeota archaeon]|nr:hypothetical protein [Candidatus Helarchaeota archaeon]